MTRNDSLLTQATRHYEYGEYRRSLEILQASMNEVRDDGKAWRLKGLAHYELREISEAADALEHAALLVPLCPLAQCRLAQSYVRLRRREVALLIFQHLVSLHDLPEHISECVAKGLLQIDACDMALMFCLNQLKRFRNSHRLLFTTSSVMRRLSYDHEEALPFSLRALQLRPNNLYYRISCAQQMVAVDQRGAAVELLAEVNLDRVQSIASLNRLLLLFERLDDQASAEHCHMRLQQIGYEISSMYRPPRSS